MASSTLPPGINAKSMEKAAQELVNLFDDSANVLFSPTGCSVKRKPQKAGATTAATARVDADRGYNERDGE